MISSFVRTLVDLPKDQIDALDTLSRAERRSRAALIRAAVADYLMERDATERRAAMEAVFGLWKARVIDGLEYQERIRSEWDRGSDA